MEMNKSMNETTQLLTLDSIKDLCGVTSYKRGVTYYRANRVTNFIADSERLSFRAMVAGTSRYQVRVDIHPSGGVKAQCTCPAYGDYYDYCKHIAAVLLHIHEFQKRSHSAGLFGGPQPQKRNESESRFDNFPRTSSSITPQPLISVKDLQTTNSVISIFRKYQQENRQENEVTLQMNGQPVEAEFTLYLVSPTYGQYLFAVGIRLGSKRLYVVHKIRDFLKQLEQQATIPFSKTFSFNPLEQPFKPTDAELMGILTDIHRDEAAYEEALGRYSSYYSVRNDKLLIIPPVAWDRVRPYVANANVRFEHEGRMYDRIKIVEETPPILFQLSNTQGEGFQIEIQGLNSVTVLEKYGYLLQEGTLYKVDSQQLKLISEVKRTLQYAPEHKLLVTQQHIEEFSFHVLPALSKIGTVQLSKDLANRLANPPLQAKLFVDLEGQRLTARLEFVYDEWVIDPLKNKSEHLTKSDVILMRDPDKENRIMSIIENTPLKYNGSGMYIDEEEEIYQFLYDHLPRLNGLADVYVTPAIKAFLVESPLSPKASVDVNSSNNLLEINFEVDGIDRSEIQNLLHSIIEKKKYYRLPNGTFLSLEQEDFQTIGHLLEELGVRKSEIKGDHLQLPVVRGLQLEEIHRASSITLGRSLRKLLDNMKNPDNLEFEIPPSLSTVLRDYQKFGFHWLKTLAHYQFGGILADDMGLGKTLQSIAYILSEQNRNKAAGKPVLIVCPASLVYNWRNEFGKFAPELKVVVAAGVRQERQELLSDISDVDVLITSYPLLRRDTELYEKIRFSILILDEAQAIKNSVTQTAQAVKQIRANQRFALTGTPIENSLDELWSLFNIVFPGLFSSKKAFGELPREKVARMIRPFILRRMKQDVLKELPEKIETIQTSELLSEQKKLYLAYLEKIQEETVSQLQQEGFHKSRMKILSGLTRLRQICCHPSMFIENYTGSSGKLEQLMEVVEECLDGGKRMLIFSQFTEMLGIIRGELNKRKLSYFYLDGKTPSDERLEKCNRFNQGEHDIFLISLKAGGTGLNLTGADTVILFDLWWNPAVEQQAADRAHRIGQKKVVQVIRLVTQGTIEEKMYELQQRKKDLIDQVIQPGETSLSSLTEEEIRELLMIPTGE